MEPLEYEVQGLPLLTLAETLGEDALGKIRGNIAALKVLMSRYRCAMMEVETKFKVLNEEFSLANDRNHIDSIHVRLKSMESIIEKLYRRRLPLTVESIEENLNDVAGVRIICPFVDDIYVLADCLLQQSDVELLQMKDYIRTPKENGYRSLHLIITVPIFLQNKMCRVKVEVQLRTIAMNFWASLEHQMRYKKDIPPSIAQKLYDDLKECADISAMMDQRMQDIKNRIEEDSSHLNQ